MLHLDIQQSAQVFFTFSLVIILAVPTTAQIQVIDSKEQQPIPYTSISIPQQNSVFLSSYNGEFSLDSIPQNTDSIYVSCIGYQNKLVAIRDISATTKIELVPVAINLNEVVVKAARKRYKPRKLGVRQKPRMALHQNHIIGNNGEEKAVWIPNPQSIAGYLKNVHVYISNGGYPQAHFRLHVYDCAPWERKPGKELTSSNIIMSGKNGNEWLSISLYDQNIPVSKQGCFIGIEWFDLPESMHFEDTLELRRNNKDYQAIKKGKGVVLGAVLEAYRLSKNKLWTRTSRQKWQAHAQVDESNFNPSDPNIQGFDEEHLVYPIPCIYIDAVFPKQKMRSIYKAPKKRKLRQLQDYKEDLFKYPQATVKELFASLIKAFEADDIIYALQYLCVYQKGELDHLLEQLDIQKKHASPMLPEEQQQKIIAHFKKIHQELPSATLIHVEGISYTLKSGEDRYNLVLKNGAWKINPATQKIID